MRPKDGILEDEPHDEERSSPHSNIPSESPHHSPGADSDGHNTSYNEDNMATVSNPSRTITGHDASSFSSNEKGKE